MNNKRRRVISALLACALIVSLTACSGDTDTSSEASNSSASQTESAASSEASTETVEIPADAEDHVRPDDGKEVGYQLEKPADGEEIAVLHTSMGDIRIRLFPDAAPKAVENFKGLINDGYYNGIVFHRVIDNFMIQGGDPTATGSGGESIWGEPFEDEFNTNLINLRGALSMANSGVDTNGSQFFIVQCKDTVTDDTAESMMTTMYMNRETCKATLMLNEKAASGASQEELNAYVDGLNNTLNQEYMNGVPEDQKAVLQKAIDLYKEVGGTPHLDYKHTVFGQVFEEDMAVVDQIAAVETDENDKPTTDVTIESAEITTYHAE